MVDNTQSLSARPATPILTSAHKIAVAGLGLIGGSLARRLVERGRYVVAWDIDESLYEAAHSVGIHTVDTIENLALGKPDVLVLATPLKAMSHVLSRLGAVLPETTTLMDVGSVKEPLRKLVVDAGLARQYIGGHPMTGNELSGFECSDASLFRDALWALCVDDHTDLSRFLTVADVVTQGLGNRFICIDDETHDRSVALISHVPHVVATALAALLSASSDRQIAGALAAGSWRDMTRVSLTDPARTQAMVEENAQHVGQLLNDISLVLGQQAQLLLAADQSEVPIHEARQRLTAFFASAQPYRNYRAAQAHLELPVDNASLGLLDVSDGNWQAELFESAGKGQQIVRFLTTHQAQFLEVSGW